MAEIVSPTKDEILEESGLKCILRESESGWRHGTDERRVFKRESDGTYWDVSYRLSTDGEYHGVKEGDYTCFRVEPFSKTVTDYRPI